MHINRDNFELFFLLGVDRELDQNQTRELEQFLAENEDLRKEFDLLRQTRLVPEEIFFDDKDTLLRREGKRKFLPGYLLRIAAAIVLLIAGSWLILTLVRKSNPTLSGENMKPVLIKPAEKVPREKLPSSEENQPAPALKAAKEALGNEPALSYTRNPGQALAKKPAVKLSNPDTRRNGHQGIKSQIIPAESIPETDQAVLKKSNSVLELQSREGQIAANSGSLSAPAVSAVAPLVIQSPDHSAVTGVQNSRPQEEQNPQETAISVMALSEKNKSISTFFQKLTKRNSTDANNRNLQVSVFNISYK